VELADSIRSLLGLDLAARLANDLHTYTRKQASATPNKDVDSKLGQVQAEITSLDKQIARAEQSQAQVRASKDLLIAQIERTETTLRAEGGEFAQSRAELISEEKLLAARQEELQTALRSLCAETLPFALAPELSTALLRQLDAEQHLVQRQASLRELSHINRAASTELSRCLKEAGFDTKAAKKAVNAVQKWLNRHAAGQTASEHAMIHGLSTKDSRQLTATLTDALTIAPNRFTQLNTTLATLVNRRIAVQSALTKIPSDEHLAPILQKLQSLNQQLGACTEKLLAAEKNLRDLEYQRAEQQRLFDKLLSQKSSAGKNSAKITLANKVIYAMDDYMTRLTHRKIAQLNLAVLDKYAQLSRKSDAIKSISVDAETFRVTLLDSQDNAIEMKELSAGEKQILAVATLWALASTAGRLLPIVIDTPLGRLDSSHRTNLITNYFPFASHQVIILSTDTEVDKALYQELSPHISTVYHLIYDKSTKRTESQSGYFWQ
jgi:DNA sulfur modification protein DndD